MVCWVEHAMYHPSLRRLVWTRVDAKPPWSSWTKTEPSLTCHDPTKRGQLIHALPWGSSPGVMAHAWVDLVADPMAGMESFHALPDAGYGLVSTLNQVLHRARPLPVLGTVDGAVAFGHICTGVEIKTGSWKHSPVWEKQITRHLTYYPRVLLFVVTS